MARITLAIHPWYGDEVAVEKRHGTHGVCVEHADGRSLVVDRRWTDLEPRLEPLIHDGRHLLLTPEAALDIARWVEDRKAGVESDAT